MAQFTCYSGASAPRAGGLGVHGFNLKVVSCRRYRVTTKGASRFSRFSRWIFAQNFLMFEVAEVELALGNLLRNRPQTDVFQPEK
jgi:hypothetical protein